MYTNIHIIWVPEGEEREKGVENIFDEITAENFLMLKKETYSGTGSTESPKQDEHKETPNKTYHN